MTTYDLQPTLGYVKASGKSFDGDAFKPVSKSEGFFYPSATLGFGKTDAYLPPLNEGEYFQVEDKSYWEIGQPVLPNNFLNYADAYEAAKGRGEYGCLAEIVIMSPSKPRKVTAIGAEGEEVVIYTVPEYFKVEVSSRLVFPRAYTD